MTPTLVRALPRLALPGTAAAMISTASSQVGYREGEDNDNVFGEWYGMNHAAWCAIFQSYAAAHSGCGAVIPKHAYTPSGAAWFQARNQWGTRPRVGALAYFYGATAGRIHHVGLVVRLLEHGAFVTVEGNTNTTGSAVGNGVYKLRRSGVGGSKGGFGYPAYAGGPVRLSYVLRVAKSTGLYNFRVAAALRAEGLTADVKGYAAWQRKCGLKGKDANGYAGLTSLSALGAAHGWKVIP